MKLVSVIISPKMQILGFGIEGKRSEFNEFGSERVTKNVGIDGLMKSGFSNSQVFIKDGFINPKGNFRLTKLPMFLFKEDGSFERVKNTLTITKRYMFNGEPIGFDVQFGTGLSGKYKYADVITLCGTFEPTNIVIKNNASGKMFIAGKAGMPLSSLPFEDVTGTESKAKSKSVKAKGITSLDDNGYDVIDLFEFVKSINGSIVKFEDTDYKMIGTSKTKTDERFVRYPFGEMGSSKLSFSKDKFNANCVFRQYGAVNIGGNGGIASGRPPKTVTSFVFRTRTIFNNGEANLKKFGVYIDAQYGDQLISKFGRSMAIKKVEDEKVLGTIRQLINIPGREFYTVDVSNIDIMSKVNAKKHIMSYADLYNTVENRELAETRMQYLNGEIKRIKSEGIMPTKKDNEIDPMFKSLSSDELAAAIEAGINVKTGVFTAEEKFEVQSSGEKPTVPQADYTIPEIAASKFTYAKVNKTIESGKEDTLPEYVADIIAEFADKDCSEKLDRMIAAREVCKEDIENYRRQLWLHKTAHWVLADKKAIHKVDASKWDVHINNRAKSTQYECNDADAKGLVLVLNNIDIR